MTYAIEVAKTLTTTLRRFATLNPHQLAGHLANLDFWLDEVKHCTRLLDEYRKRFEAMKSAQLKEARSRGTIEFTLDDDHFESTPSPPRAIPHSEIQETRRELLDVAYQFLLQCYKSRLIDRDALDTALESIGTSTDPADLAT